MSRSLFLIPSLDLQFNIILFYSSNTHASWRGLLTGVVHFFASPCLSPPPPPLPLLPRPPPPAPPNVARLSGVWSRWCVSHPYAVITRTKTNCAATERKLVTPRMLKLSAILSTTQELFETLISGNSPTTKTCLQTTWYVKTWPIK